MGEIRKYFMDIQHGGYSNCISGNELKNPWFDGCTLSNCVGFCWG